MTANDRVMARQASDLLFAFARDGEPSAKGLTDWQSDRILRDRTMIFGPDEIEQRRNFRKVRLDVLKGATKIVDLFAKP